MSIDNDYNYKGFLTWKQDQSKKIEDEYYTDSRLGKIYLENPDLKLVAEVAIVTGRPLLLRGEPGSGKSSFAPFAARNLNWRYYEYNVTGRTEAKDLLWRFDSLRRLRDAKAERADLDEKKYITPGVLWKAFDYEQASEYLDEKTNDEFNVGRSTKGAVVLIDEIDKADPNVPNDLLEAVGMNTFKIDEIGIDVKRTIFSPKDNPLKPLDYGNLLIVITTNQERDLPAAFVRRCVFYNLKGPQTEDELIKHWTAIAKLHLSKSIGKNPQGKDLLSELVEKCWTLREESKKEIRKSPSTAEFLDALKACLTLEITTESPNWTQIKESVLTKKTS